MTGPLILKTNPAEDLEAATKQYVDNHTSDVVFYTPQTLTDEQKAQARGNINSAPGGFGLGAVSATFSDANDCTINGWYRDPDGNAKNTPWKWSHILVTTFLPNTYVRQDAYITGGPASVPSVNHAVRIKHPDFPEENAFWGPWEYESGIPMQLGVEYRTTERYLGKPVYCKVVNFGIAPNNDTKNVSLSGMNIDEVCDAIFHYYVPRNGENGVMTCHPNFTGLLVSNGVIQIRTNADTTDTNFYVTIKYTKTTD